MRANILNTTVIVTGAILIGSLYYTTPRVQAAGPAAEKPAVNLPTPASNKAQQAWREFVAFVQSLQPPASWQTQQPSEEEIAEFRKKQAEHAYKSAVKAKEFYTEFPDSENAAQAKQAEQQLLNAAANMGHKKAVEALQSLEKSRLDDPNANEDQKFQIRAQRVQRAAMELQSEGMDAVIAEFEKGTRELMKQYPEREEVYDMLLSVASNSDNEKARKIANEIIDSPASEETKTRAQGLLNKLDQLGKPIEISFTSLSGKEVDVQKMDGKVVLIDFWATWCAPCVEELPNVKEVYNKYNDKGFEIVGISFDNNKAKLESFVKENNITWPQYFDGKGWQNKFGQRYGISSIPAMWLVDKSGKLRYMNARSDLEQKVKELLAEQESGN